MRGFDSLTPHHIMTEFEQKLHRLLVTFLGSEEEVVRWWAAPNKEFDGAIPDDLYHSVDKNKVIKYILDLGWEAI